MKNVITAAVVGLEVLAIIASVAFLITLVGPILLLAEALK